jgi:hypothetical protein
MNDKTAAIKIIAALGILLFPLGARFYLAQNSAPGFTETAQAPRDIQETPARALESKGPVETGSPVDERLPPIGAETLARVFRAPNKTARGGKPPEDAAIAQPQAVPGDGKFSYLGSIRESNDREWIYIKEKDTGRIISVNASLASINEDRYVVEIEGASYFIRRE